MAMRPRSLMDPGGFAFPDVNMIDELVSDGGGGGGGLESTVVNISSTTIWCIPTKLSLVDGITIAWLQWLL